MITSSVSSSSMGAHRALAKYADHTGNANHISKEAVADKAESRKSSQPAERMIDKTVEGSRPDGQRVEEVELAREMTGLMITKQEFEANLRALKLSDEMLQSLLDIFA